MHITVGNESCDLDSIVCAVCHAHFLAHSKQLPSLPLLQCSREDLALRTDAVWLFSQLQLTSGDLLFLEEALPVLRGVRRVSVTLVDHATPSGPLAELPNLQISSVIDHHLPAPSPSVQDCVVEPVGSCATLVAERLLRNQEYSMGPPVATLLLGAILLDTVGLEEKAGRVTDKDRLMAQRLGSLVKVSPSELNASLSEARLSVAGLSPHQLLRKDMKTALVSEHRIGFSSITCLLSPQLLGNGDMEEAVQALCVSRSLSVLLVVCVSVDGGAVNREIAVFQSRDRVSDLAEGVASLLESDEGLQCQRIPSSSSSCILFRQGNPQFSRKQILPLVTNFISSL